MNVQPVSHVLFTCLIIGAFNSLYAQSTCHRYLVLKDTRIELTSWQQDTSDIFQYEKDSYDSVAVYHNAHLTAAFLSKSGQIISPRLVKTDKNDRVIAIDSFAPAGTFHTKPQKYFGHYYAPLFSHREYYSGGMSSMLRYYDRNGEDSLELYWRPNGILEKREQHGITYAYSETGILQSRRSQDESERSIDYYDSGTIQSLSFDTTVKNQLVHCVLDYSPNGTLLKESWFKNGKPCATWREYNRYGALIKTIHHTPLQQVQTHPYEIMAMETEEVLYFVDEPAEFPGGMAGLARFTDSKLAEIPCKLQESLTGSSYELSITIDRYGSAVYQSVSGTNSAVIAAQLEKIVTALPRWKPAKVDGRTVMQVIVLELKVKSR